jgi:hypothetical protein
VFLLAAGELALRFMPFYAAAMALSAAVHFFNLRHLSTPKSLATPLTTIGLRAMAVSIAFTLLLVAGS